jgi:hypothetical protein
MATLDRIANVSIALATASIQAANFSSMLVLAPHNLDTARVMAVTDPSDLLTEGVAPTDALYLAVSAVFGQIPSLTQLMIGRQQVLNQSLLVATPVSQGDIFSFNIGYVVSGVKVLVPFTYTAPATPTSASVATALAAAITAAITGGTLLPLTAAASGSSVDLTGSGVYSLEDLTANLSVPANPASTEDVITALAACQAENPAWYGLNITSRVAADQLDAAAWAEGQLKLFGTCTADPTALATTTTDVMAQVAAKNYFRTFVYYHALAATEYLESAIMSKKFTINPGGENWANSTLAGITADNISDTASINVSNKNGNTFEPFKDQDAVVPTNLTQYGKVGGNEWIDIIRFRDWLADTIKVNVVSAGIDRRIPFTDPGIRVIKSAIQSAMDLGVKRGGLAPASVDAQNNVIPSYTITVPLRADISNNDVANRQLNDVAFTAILAGSINNIVINGTLAYSFGAGS